MLATDNTLRNMKIQQQQKMLSHVELSVNFSAFDSNILSAALLSSNSFFFFFFEFYFYGSFNFFKFSKFALLLYLQSIVSRCGNLANYGWESNKTLVVSQTVWRGKLWLQNSRKLEKKIRIVKSFFEFPKKFLSF